MATQIIMPKLGMAMTEGTVVKWLKQDGDTVAKGEPIVVVMSKKITYTVEAPASGILRIVAGPKETRAVGQVIGFILSPGEPMPAVEMAPPPAPKVAAVEVREAPPPPPPPPEMPREVRASPAARRLARELGVDIARVSGSGPEGRITEADVRAYYEQQQRIQATPLARRIAEEEGLDLSQIQGTGPGGRITEEDVLRALEGRRAPAAPPRAIPFTGMRQAIAERMMESLHSTAQLTLTTRADVTELVGLREILSQRWSVRLSYTDFIVKATAQALKEHPILNSTLVGEEIVLHEDVHIGVAVALEEGLIVPVICHADRKSLLEIHQTLQDLAERARKGELSVDEVTGSTFTITNLGMYGIDAFTPIINPPEVAILGVGRISEELALVSGQVAARSCIVLSLTIDHRVVDGAPGAAFLQTVVRYLEHPALIFI
ncbi:MAG: dihydrolipoamide acetyltransferase family protein [Anaerolineae bacterium]|jgi:pyruvate dehydrogenase E2 component (dihydrolipoamide acetyltransferase)